MFSKLNKDIFIPLFIAHSEGQQGEPLPTNIHDRQCESSALSLVIKTYVVFYFLSRKLTASCFTQLSRRIVSEYCRYGEYSANKLEMED